MSVVSEGVPRNGAGIIGKVVAIEQPATVDVGEIVVRPTAQA